MPKAGTENPELSPIPSCFIKLPDRVGAEKKGKVEDKTGSRGADTRRTINVPVKCFTVPQLITCQSSAYTSW